MTSDHPLLGCAGELEREAYAQQSQVGLDKFDTMVGSRLRLVSRLDGVTIYEVLLGKVR